MTESQRTPPLHGTPAPAADGPAASAGKGGATTQPTRSAVGVVVDGRYHIVDPIAAGGMGSVYLGEQLNLRRKVAIKLIKQPDPADAERFRREAEALAELSHPAIVEVFDYLEDRDAEVAYLVMAYVAGENMADYQAGLDAGVLPPLEALELLLPVASALVELHAHGILHRDIKPANLVRYQRADGRAAVKLVDFGIVRREKDPGLTADGLIVGTPPYLSPEVILGKKHSEASDVFAFGAMFYELLCGTPPHGNDELHAILKRAIHDDVRLPPPLMGTGVGALLLHTLAREETDRPRMQAVLEELERLRLGLLLADGQTAEAMQATRALSSAIPPVSGTGATLPPSPAPAPGARVATAAPAAALPPRRSSSAPWIVAGLAMAVAVGLGLFVALRSPSSPQRSSEAPDSARADVEVAAHSPDARRPAADHRFEVRRAADHRPEVRRPAAPVAASESLTFKALVAKTLTQCTDMNAAYRLFIKANYRYKLHRKPRWVRAVFTALLACTHTQLPQKRWVAFRLGLIQAKAGRCEQAAATWRRYVVIARKVGVKPAPAPPCDPAAHTAPR